MPPPRCSRAAATCLTPSRWRWCASSKASSARRPTRSATGPPRATVAELGDLNDRSYTFGTDSFSRALQTLPDGAAHIYVARDEGQPVGCLTIVDHEGNSEVQMVAVVPEARGRGITTKLLAHALADAIERGNKSSTLISTPLGYPVYERVGFRPLERVSMWERAPA